jgi:hypothetical protein
VDVAPRFGVLLGSQVVSGDVSTRRRFARYRWEADVARTNDMGNGYAVSGTYQFTKAGSL